MRMVEPRVERLEVSAYLVPTDRPESDGTLQWESTTVIVLEAHSAGKRGLGYSYTHAAAAVLVRELLCGIVENRPAMDVVGTWAAMRHAVRNVGRPGLASAAISAVDTALWDLKARLLDLPLVALLGAVRDEVAVYGSGGFTSYTDAELRAQLAGWVEQGISRVKMKIGREPDRDLARVRAAREAIGAEAELFVDANGAYDRKQALRFGDSVQDLGVSWFEEPVSSDDLEGLRLIRDRTPAGMEVAAGEYGYDLFYFRRMLDAGAVDVLQADITRCGGTSELVRVGALCDARSLPLSGHTAPALHAHVACALPSMRHLEYFHDHVRIEERFFEGVLKPVDGALRPDRSRPGMGLEFKHRDAERFRA